MTAGQLDAVRGAPEPELGAALVGQRMRARATRPPIDPRMLRFDPVVGRHLVVTGLLAAVTAGALIAQATALAAIIARTFLAGAALEDHGGWLLLLVVAVVVRAGAKWLEDVVSHRTAARVKSRLRSAVIARLVRETPDDRGGSTGEVAGILTDGIDALDGTFSGYLPALVSGVVVPAAILAWVVTQDPISALVLAVTLPLIPLFMVLIGLAARAAARRRFRALTALSGQLLAVLQGLPTIRLARATGRVRSVVHEAAERLRRTTLETLRVAFVSALALELLAALAVATVAVTAGVRLAQGTGVAFEPVLVALLLAPEAFLPLRRVGQQFHANEDGAAAAERLLDLLEGPVVSHEGAMPPTVAAGRGAPAAGDVAGRRPAPDPARTPVVFTRIGVHHPDRSLPALDRVDLEVVPGQRLAVLGVSGAGKTTLASVLLGLRAPDDGRVMIGNVDLADLDPDAWHARIGWVPQAPADLPGTIRELVTLGVSEVTGCDPVRAAELGSDRGVGEVAAHRPDDAEVWGALASVGIDAEVAAMPDGLDTAVGPGGRGLSAGQRRRLAIARALLRDAGLLVLDEPTGDLDVDAERAVRGALDELRGRRTVVLLTHRIALARDADQVVVLDEGRVVEQGTPGELVHRDGAYAALVRAARPLEPQELAAEPGTPLDGPGIALDAAPVAARVAARATDTAPGGFDAGAPGLQRRLLDRHRRTFALAVAAGAITPVAGVALVAVSTYLIARAALEPNILDLTVLVVAVRALSLLKGVSRYVERLAGHDVALRTVVDLRVGVYDRLVPQSPAGLARHRVGDVLARVVADVERLQLALVRGVVPLLGGLVASVVVVLIATVLLPTAGLIVAVGLTLAAIGVPFVAAKASGTPEHDLARARGQLAAALVETLQAAPELRLLGRLDPALRHLDDLDNEVVRRDRSSVVRGGFADALVQLMVGLTAVGLVVVGVPAVTSGALDGVLLGALVVLALGAVEAIGPLPAASLALATARAAEGRLRSVLAAPEPAADPPVGAQREGDVTASRLTVEQATARYPGADGAAPAVQDLDLEVGRGRRVAVVGRSGAGKSTLANLTVRFLDPVAGAVRLDGAALTELAGDQVRGVVGLAPQGAHVFDGSIATNLRLAAPAATEHELRRVVAATNLDGWIASLPDGLDTAVGEEGCRLSGGQRHRLALARTLLAGAPLLVLDEPTADLDPRSGRAFLADTLRVAGDRGVLLLTHDLRALPVVDEVVVLDAGRVVARGSHRVLLAEDAAYAARWQLEVGVGR